MGCKNSKNPPVPEEDFNLVFNSTKFTRGEIEYLYYRFRQLGGARGSVNYLVKQDFNFSLHALHSLILREMFGNKTQLSFVEFAKFLHIFRAFDSKSKKEERDAIVQKRLKIMFSMYDTSKDGIISRDELMDIVHRLYSDYTDIRTMVRIADIVMKEMNQMKSNELMFDDFCRALEVFDMELLAIKFPSL